MLPVGFLALVHRFLCAGGNGASGVLRDILRRVLNLVLRIFGRAYLTVIGKILHCILGADKSVLHALTGNCGFVQYLDVLDRFPCFYLAHGDLLSPR